MRRYLASSASGNSRWIVLVGKRFTSPIVKVPCCDAVIVYIPTPAALAITKPPPFVLKTQQTQNTKPFSEQPTNTSKLEHFKPIYLHVEPRVSPVPATSVMLPTSMTLRRIASAPSINADDDTSAPETSTRAIEFMPQHGNAAVFLTPYAYAIANGAPSSDAGSPTSGTQPSTSLHVFLHRISNSVKESWYTGSGESDTSDVTAVTDATDVDATLAEVGLIYETHRRQNPPKSPKPQSTGRSVSTHTMFENFAYMMYQTLLMGMFPLLSCLYVTSAC